MTSAHALNHGQDGGFDKTRKLLVSQETCSAGGACGGGVELETLGNGRRVRCFTRREVFLKQFVLLTLILTIVLLFSFSAGDPVSQ